MDSKNTKQIEKRKRVNKVIFLTFFIALGFYAIWVHNSSNEEFVRIVRVTLKSTFFWGVIVVFTVPFINKYIKVGFKPKKEGNTKSMNNRQKIFLIVGVVSIAIFVSTAYHYSTSGMGRNIFGSYYGNMDNLKYQTNWLGFITIGTSLASLFGYFLFKDK